MGSPNENDGLCTLCAADYEPTLDEMVEASRDGMRIANARGVGNDHPGHWRAMAVSVPQLYSEC